jgi:FkbM family methyltransferase
VGLLADCDSEIVLDGPALPRAQDHGIAALSLAVTSIRCMTNTAKIDCVVVDGGARYGLHPTWADLRTIAQFHLFEMDTQEAERLRTKYENDPAIDVHPIGLYREDTELTFTVNEHRALNSLFSVDDEMLKRNEYMRKAFTPIETKTASVRSIDSFFKGRPIHFLKLDVEGAEYDVLSGGVVALRSSVLAVRAEVVFTPVYKEAPAFGDVHKLLIENGYELLNFDYSGAGNKGGRFSLPGRYGKLISTDAVWIVNNQRLFSTDGTALRDDVVRLACFLLNNGATDLAVEILQRAVSEKNISFEEVQKDLLFNYMRRKILLLFKSLLAYPIWSETEIYAVYRQIFNSEFPTLNRFYESEMFS